MNEYSPVYRRCGCTDPATGRRYGDNCPRLADDLDHGSWYFAVRIGGQRVRRGGFRTAQDAEQARQEVVGQAPEPAADAGLTVGAWLDTWVASLPKQVRPSTATAYTAHVVNVLRPALGHHRLGALTRAQVQAMFDELASHTNRYDVTITASTVQRVRATLRRALNAAAAHGYLTDNPARMLELPPPRRHRPVAWSQPQPQVAAWLRDGTRPKIAVWTPRQLATFLTAVADDDLYALWWLAGLRGLRRGELVGLRWVDLDLADATLTVTQTLVELPGVVAESEPKTAAGNRTITLDPATVKVLADHRRRQQRRYEAYGTVAEETGLVFAWPDGRPIRPGWLTHRFTALVAEHGLPPVRLHDLRHGTAMNALHGSASLHTVQHLLGHSSHAFTADVYGTVPDRWPAPRRRARPTPSSPRCGTPNPRTCRNIGLTHVDVGPAGADSSGVGDDRILGALPGWEGVSSRLPWHRRCAMLRGVGDEHAGLDAQDSSDGPVSGRDARLAKVGDRAVAAGLEAWWTQFRNPQTGQGEGPYGMRVHLPSGQRFRSVSLVGGEEAEVLLKFPFERWTVLQGYEAILDPDQQRIVAEVTLLGTSLSRIPGVVVGPPETDEPVGDGAAGLRLAFKLGPALGPSSLTLADGEGV